MILIPLSQAEWKTWLGVECVPSFVAELPSINVTMSELRRAGLCERPGHGLVCGSYSGSEHYVPPHAARSSDTFLWEPVSRARVTSTAIGLKPTLLTSWEINSFNLIKTRRLINMLEYIQNNLLRYFITNHLTKDGNQETVLDVWLRGWATLAAHLLKYPTMQQSSDGGQQQHRKEKNWTETKAARV